MARVMLRHPVTGRMKVLQSGWSWSCFFGSNFLGLPLFMRGLAGWGAAMVVLNALTLELTLAPPTGASTLDSWLPITSLALSFFFGIRANAMAADRYLKNGWIVVGPERRF